MTHTDWWLRKGFRHNILALGGRLNSKLKRVSILNGLIVPADDTLSDVFTGARTRRASKRKEKNGLENSGMLTCDKSISRKILPSSLSEEHIRLIEKKDAAPSISKGEIRL